MFKKLGAWLAKQELAENAGTINHLRKILDEYNDQIEDKVMELAASHRDIGDKSDSGTFKLKQHAKAEALEEFLEVFKNETRV